MRPLAQLAQLLGCTEEELRADLQRMGDEQRRALPDDQLPAAVERKVAQLRSRKCTAIIGDGNMCERAAGHGGLHTHIGNVWDGKHVWSGRSRCAAVSPAARELGTLRCVLELGHEAAHHELDDGSVFS